MQQFANLWAQLEITTNENEKIDLFHKYVTTSSNADLAWSIYFFNGRRIKTPLKVAQLRRWVQEEADVEDWLFDECYSDVGDLCETIALLVQEKAPHPDSERDLNTWINQVNTQLLKSEEDQRIFVVQAWQQLSDVARVLFNKMITGTARSPLGTAALVEALSRFSGADRRVIAQRLSLDFEPSAEFIDTFFISGSDTDNHHSFAFVQSRQLDFEDLAFSGSAQDWLIDWNWDGIRAQLIKREQQISIWSSEDQLLSSQFPELIQEAKALPDDTVLEGMIFAWKDADVLPFEMLKQRLNRKNITAKLKEDVPVVFMAQDLLEKAGVDLRDEPFEKRRAALSEVLSKRSQIPDEKAFQQLQLFAPCRVQLSSILRYSAAEEVGSWDQLQQLRKSSRKLNADGLVLRKRVASYGAENAMLVCNAEPLTVTAVLVAAQSAIESRRRIFDDYTFAVWKNDELVPFVRTRADAENSEENAVLTNEEIKNIDSFVRKNTLERFGPVCTVKPQLVFELSCRAIQKSQRNKAGISVRFPRIIKFEAEKSAADADTIEKILQLLN